MQEEAEMFEPFDCYKLEVDKEIEEVYIVAWDEDSPHDRFYAKVDLAVLLEMLGPISEELTRG